MQTKARILRREKGQKQIQFAVPVADKNIVNEDKLAENNHEENIGNNVEIQVEEKKTVQTKILKRRAKPKSQPESDNIDIACHVHVIASVPVVEVCQTMESKIGKKEDTNLTATTTTVGTVNENILTRYYYVKQAVFVSLMISIFEKDIDESLFWAYELYYSGFADDVLEFCKYIYKDFFNVYNSVEFEKKIDEEYDKWNKDKDNNDCILGNIVANFVCRPYTIIPYLKNMYCSIEEMEKIDFKKYFEKDVSFYVVFDKKSFDKYKTHNVLNTENIHSLQRYKIRLNEYNLMMKTIEKHNVIHLNIVYNNWIDHIQNSYIWKTNMEKNGIEWKNGRMQKKDTHEAVDLDLCVAKWTFEQREKIGMIYPDDEYAKDEYGWQDFYNLYYLNTPYKMDVAVTLSKLPM